MNRLLYKKTTLSNLKPSHIFNRKIFYSFGQYRKSITSLKDGTQPTNTPQIDNRVNDIKKGIDSIWKIPSNHSFIQKYSKNFLHYQNFQTIHQNSYQNQQKNKQESRPEILHQKYNNFHEWLKRLILITFITSLLQQDDIKCDYDINDMMITIELDQRLLTEEEENAEEQESQASKEKRRKKFRSRRSSIKQNGHSKDQRYGTVQEMLKHQMESSEDFHSVEERFLIKDIEGKRDQKKESQSQKQAEKPQKQPHKDQTKQNIAHHIFRQENKQQHFTQAEAKESEQAKKQAVIIEKDIGKVEDKSLMAQSQKYIENDKELNENQKTIQITADMRDSQLKQEKEESKFKQEKNLPNGESESVFNMDFPKAQIEKQSITEELNTKQAQETTYPLKSIPIDSQNSATIFLQSPNLKPLAKRIQNFLKLRGITIHLQQGPKDTVKSSESQNKSLKIRLCNKLTECKDIQFKPENEQNRDVFHYMNNFLHPPHVINSIQQAKSLLNLLETDQSLIGSYIPKSTPEFQAYKHKSSFNTWSARNPPTDPSIAQKTFNEYKYLSSSKKNCFIIVRDQEVAKYLKIPTNKIGIPHIMFKHDSQLNGKQSEPNCKIDGDFYHAIGNLDKMIQKEGLDTVEKVAEKINLLTERGFIQTNVIEDVHDKIRQMNEQANGFSFTQKSKQNNHHKKQKKLFVIKTNDPQSETQINQILQKLSKLNKNDVSILKTQSQALLKSLKIFTNDEYATIRLFDFQHSQEPIVKQDNSLASSNQKEYFERYVPNGPFQLEFLSRWISNLSPFDKPHTEVDRSLNKLKASYPHELFEQNDRGKAKLVLFYKEGCKGCKLMEELLSHLNQLKERLKAGDIQSSAKLRRQICLRYRIQNPEQLSQLQITKFNILNDDQTIQVPQTTPTIYLFNPQNKQKYVVKTQQVFNQLNRMKTGNDEVVHDYMMRQLIEEIERGVRRMDNVA